MTSTEPYIIYGSENSPYSTKVRSYFRYKQIPHEWRVRNASTQGTVQCCDTVTLMSVTVVMIRTRGMVRELAG